VYRGLEELTYPYHDARLVTFMQYDLGYFDDETCRVEPIENPFGPKVILWKRLASPRANT
ncbi:MAG TPA: hypothetical protein VM736_10655, partial [Gemmatimonadales bacterium]|nr:hypothetical protein [Gemmatimonadales bacterium]